MPFLPLKFILPKAIQQAGLDVQVSAAQVVDEAQASLVRLWDPERAAHVHTVSFKEGTLKVAATAPAAAHALRLIETQWMNEINRGIGSRKVMKIVMQREGF